VDDSPAVLDRLQNKDSETAAENEDDAKPNDREPHVLARFETRDRAIFLVERQIGRGRVLFCSSGLLSSWNTLPKTNAILMFDRILRGMIQSSLPDRNVAAMDRLALPLPQVAANQRVTLTRPGANRAAEPLDVTYVGASRRGV